MERFTYPRFRIDKISKAFPNGHIVAYPQIPVTVNYNSLKIPSIEALIDSGSLYTIFSYEIGKDLGLNVKAGKHHKIYGISSGSVDSWFHVIRIRIKRWNYQCYVGFAMIDKLPVSGILGYIGFFDRFSVELNDRKQEIVINRL
ncbi:retropepsin-like domain-containing protein [Caldithrix abyssi]|nr:retropepsin-like domain-containing protein [Caldithrix abyssi]